MSLGLPPRRTARDRIRGPRLSFRSVLRLSKAQGTIYGDLYVVQLYSVLLQYTLFLKWYNPWACNRSGPPHGTYILTLHVSALLCIHLIIHNYINRKCLVPIFGLVNGTSAFVIFSFE